MSKIKDIVKKIIRPETEVFKIILFFYRFDIKYWQPRYVENIAHLLKQYVEVKQDIFFVQIGSNDGKSGDPIYQYILKHNWRGILVEPVRYLFERLKKNYHSKKEFLIFENVAIASSTGSAIFYYLRENNDGLRGFYSQIGSFDLDTVMSHKTAIPNIEDYIVKEEIAAITFNHLLSKNKINKVDLVHIDAEGYDYEIIKTIDFQKTRPDIILFESKHLVNEDYKQCVKLLKKNGYVAYKNNIDTIAIQRSRAKNIDVKTKFYLR